MKVSALAFEEMNNMINNNYTRWFVRTTGSLPTAGVFPATGH